MTRIRTMALAVPVGVMLALGLVACGDDSGDSATPDSACEIVDGTAGGGDPSMTVGLTEWSVSPTPAQAPVGSLTVEARNAGKETHELVIVRAPVDQLKTGPDGAVDEAQLPPGAMIGEIEGFAAGTSCTGTFQLREPGAYSFFCNIVETEADGTVESHFQQGMVTGVTVG